MSTDTQKLRGRPVTHEEARAAAQRLVDGFFRKQPAEYYDPVPTGSSIPVKATDDDVTIMDYIREQESPCPGEPIMVRADIVRNEHSGYIHMRVKNGETGLNYDFILPEWAVTQSLTQT